MKTRDRSARVSLCGSITYRFWLWMLGFWHYAFLQIQQQENSTVKEVSVGGGIFQRFHPSNDWLKHAMENVGPL